MKKHLLLFILFLSYSCFSQNGFEFETSKNKIVVPFQLVNNLIIIPLEINGVKLSFLVDSGVEKTILYSLESADSVYFNQVNKIKVRGLGKGLSIDALQSKDNKVVIDKLIDKNHEIYIILDQEVNFSSYLGVAVNGIIGYELFKNFQVEINYENKKLTFYKKNIFLNKESKKKNYKVTPFTLELFKPYIITKTTIETTEINTKLLIDSGGSDALWLFENHKDIKSPSNFFNDFLGRGFSGDIYGKRSRINKIMIADHEILNPTISFPDSLSTHQTTMVKGRNGSVGGAILKRFNLIFDYKNQLLYLKTNSNFSDPFNYNMSGIEVQHNGVQWIKEELELKTRFDKNAELSLIESESKSIQYQFVLKPLYEITSIRENTPGAIAGLKKGDILSKIDGKHAFKYKLHQINDLLQSEDDKVINLEIERENKLLKFSIKLKKIL